MADGFMAETNAAELSQWAQSLPVKLQNQIAGALYNAAFLAANEIAARAPSPSQEYDLIMRGMGTNVNLVPLGYDQSGDPDARTRFRRNPGKWMRELVFEPENMIIDYENLTVRFGNIAYLMDAVTFSYVNKNGSEYTSNFEGHLFSLLEFGGAYTVNAVHAQRLAPDATKEHRVRTMTKSFPGFRMYSGFDPAVFSEALLSRLSFKF